MMYCTCEFNSLVYYCTPTGWIWAGTEWGFEGLLCHHSFGIRTASSQSFVLELAVGNVIWKAFKIYSCCKNPKIFLGTPRQLDSGQCGEKKTTSERHLDGDGTLILLAVRLSISQGELETQKRYHEAKLLTTKEEEKHKMDKMALELELRWTETLR